MSKPSADKLKDVSEFDPEVGAYVKQLETQNQELAARAAKAPAPAPASFEPERFAPEVQQEIDAVPQMLAMQMNPDQTAFTLAKGLDTVLRKHPTWSKVTVAERFAEVARRVEADLGSVTAAPSPAPATPAPPADPRQTAIAKVQAAAAPAPVAIGDLRGGTTTVDAPDYSRMTDEDVMNDLDRHA